MQTEKQPRINAIADLPEILAEADEDVLSGKVAPMEETFSNLRSILKEKHNDL